MSSAIFCERSNEKIFKIIVMLIVAIAAGFILLGFKGSSNQYQISHLVDAKKKFS